MRAQPDASARARLRRPRSTAATSPAASTAAGSSTRWCSTSPATSRSPASARARHRPRVAVGPNTPDRRRVAAGRRRPGRRARCALDAPDIAPLAAFALVEATGALDADSRSRRPRSARASMSRRRARDLWQGASRVGALDARRRGSTTRSACRIVARHARRARPGARRHRGRLAERATPSRPPPTACASTPTPGWRSARSPTSRASSPGSTTASPRRLDALRLRQQRHRRDAGRAGDGHRRGRRGRADPARARRRRRPADRAGPDRRELRPRRSRSRDLPLDIANTVRPDLGARRHGSTAPRGSPGRATRPTSASTSAPPTSPPPPPAPPACRRSASRPAAPPRPAGSTSTPPSAAPAGSRPGPAARCRSAPARSTSAVELAVFPAALVDRAAGGRGLAAPSPAGRRSPAPSPIRPRASTFAAPGSARALLRDNGSRRSALTAAGGFARQAVTLRTATLTGAGGLSLDRLRPGRRSAGPGLDLRVAGTAAAGARRPVPRGALGAGQRAAPHQRQRRAARSPRRSYGGSVVARRRHLRRSRPNLRLQTSALDAGARGQRPPTLRSFRAEVATGGAITARGTRHARRGRLPRQPAARRSTTCATPTAPSSAPASPAQLALEGPLIGGGGLLVGPRSSSARPRSPSPRASASTPQAALEQVHHVAHPARRCRSRSTAPRSACRGARGGRRAPASGSTCASARRTSIFVRGRGLDVELGGDLRIRGTTTDVQPVGQFDLRRGRLLVLGQRIDFDEGSLQLVGNLDPRAPLRRRAPSPATSPRSSPCRARVSAPRDHLLLRAAAAAGRGAGAGAVRPRHRRTSRPFQLAQLAAAAAELAGGGGAGHPVAAARRHRPRRPRHRHRGGRRRPRCAPASTSTTTSISTCRPARTAIAAPRSRSTSTTASPPAARSARTATPPSASSTSATTDS